MFRPIIIRLIIIFDTLTQINVNVYSQYALQSDVSWLWGIDQVVWLHELLITQTMVFTARSHLLTKNSHHLPHAACQILELYNVHIFYTNVR